MINVRLVNAGNRDSAVFGQEHMELFGNAFNLQNMVMSGCGLEKSYMDLPEVELVQYSRTCQSDW